MSLLGHTSASVQTPALRCVANVATGSAEQTEAVLGALLVGSGGSLLARLLNSEKREIKKETCWMLSNLTAGSPQQIDAVCASGLVQHLVRVVETEEFDIRKEAAYALCNACIGSSAETLSGLVSLQVLPALIRCLDSADTELVLAVCDALETTLAAGEATAARMPGQLPVNPCVGLIESAGGCEKLEALQEHHSEAVYQRVARILDTFFAEARRPNPNPRHEASASTES